MLFHISENPHIERFDPRPSPQAPEPVVWAVDGEHLRNYLVPRDCPRVTYAADRDTTESDVQRFLGSSRAVVALECAWRERLRTCRLHCYHLPPETFECIDKCAGYFVSRDSVPPVSVRLIEDPLVELERMGVEVRFLEDLWPLHDAVAASTLQFSMIRMRNASRPKS